ncbi:hypothetical protein NIES4071_48230 [Calothrix sp. NIES-4071]|nr:hypothetical protein NIES4071_48230 [Calothrix sp. NIES-4071]BAZ59135.1 hypothetical protein NIES4105_48170 [Calothrix sp. NIES-4105]
MLRLFISKNYGNYADTFLMLGLARVVEYALKVTNQKSGIQLIDEGTRYCIQFKKSVNLEPIAKITYTSPFPVVKGQKTDISKIPEEANIFNTVEHNEIRKVYREFMFQRGKRTEESPQPPDYRTQNGAILTSMRHDRNHNDLWLVGWELRDYFGALIVALCQGFSQENTTTELVAELFKASTGCKLPDASAVKVYLPTSVQGVNRVKADSNKVDSQKTDWLSLWLIANGLFNFAVAERVKIAERVYDWRLVALQPQDISLSKYDDVLKQLLIHNLPGGGHGAARFDAELVIRFCQELLNHHRAANEQDDWDKPVNHFVSNFAGTHFGAKGQVYGVKEVFSLGLPAWVYPRNYNELLDYQNVLDEHLNVVRALSLDEGHSELIAAYRDFITGNDLYQFFRFQVSYADYITKMAGANARVALFSKQGLNLMLKNLNNKYRQDDREWSLTEITQDSGFLNIAKAINSATVYAGTIRDKDNQSKDTGWERIYGLAQRLISQSGSKKDFIIEIMSFLASYENENLRIDDELRKLKKPRRIWTTKDDLDRLINLIDNHGSSLVANLLIAYGYAKGWGKAKDEKEQTEESLVECVN